MISAPKRNEIDHRTIKLLIGLIALFLANLTSWFANTSITSISASYYEGGWSQSIFIGFLFAIAAFLLAYNGLSTREMLLSKTAALAALGVALFPCKCDIHTPDIPYVHGTAAAIMFAVLANFCLIFYRRARAKGYLEANRRAAVYASCGIAIVISISVIALDNFMKGAISTHIPRLTYYGERTGLVAFGISWLTASRVLPVLTRQDDRFSPFSDRDAIDGVAK
ncbi:MAG: hypothetical protein HY777_02970 [Betaproteobacteria bacterium]|nr:hypothetical protein [Betaproteobacteria bacterium]